MKLFSAAAILVALAGHAAEAGCQMNKIATLHVSVENNRILVPGTINQHPVKFILATDIESLILATPAHDFDLFRMLAARFQPIIYAEEMSTTGGPVRVADLSIDGLKMSEFVMHAVGRRVNFGAADEVAVIGREFLSKFDVEFDLPAGQVILYRPENCENANLAYWGERYNVLEMDPHLWVTRVTATVNGHTVKADINSGNPYTALNLADAPELGISTSAAIKLPPSHDFLADYPMETWQAMADSVGLDQEQIRPAALRVRRLSNPPPILHPFRDYWDSETGYAKPQLAFVPGNPNSRHGAELSIGVDFIRSHRMLIAYSQRKVYFSYVPGQPFLAPVK